MSLLLLFQATNLEEIEAQGAITFAAMVGVGELVVGDVPIEAQGAITFAAMIGAGTAVVEIDAQGAATFAAMVGSGAGEILVKGSGTATFAAMAGAGRIVIGYVELGWTIAVKAADVAGTITAGPGASDDWTVE